MFIRAKSYSTRRKNDRDLKLEYFNHVFVDFSRLDKIERESLLNDLPESLKALVQDLENAGEVSLEHEAKLDWSEIAILEDKVLARQNRDTLQRRVWQLRARFAQLVGPERYQMYLASSPPDENAATTTEEQIRADLQQLSSLTHKAYSTTLVHENVRKRILDKIAIWTIVLVVLTLVVWGLYWDTSRFMQQIKPHIGTVCIVVAFGVLGAYVSVSRRLQESGDRGDPIIGALRLSEFGSTAVYSIVAGGIFALLLYYLLVSGLLSGELFPKFSSNAVDGTRPQNPPGIPESTLSWARLIIWSFIAGFAERLVPDTLNRLVNQATSDQSAPAPGGGSAGPPAKHVQPAEGPKPGQPAREIKSDQPAKEPKRDQPAQEAKPNQPTGESPPDQPADETKPQQPTRETNP